MLGHNPGTSKSVDRTVSFSEIEREVRVLYTEAERKYGKLKENKWMGQKVS